jgi:hypothetical protein
MITSTSSADRAARPENLPAVAAKSAHKAVEDRSDRISTENAEYLRAALSRQPAVRPEVVARARALAADPSYPPMEAIRKVAEQILASPDLSEVES